MKNIFNILFFSFVLFTLSCGDDADTHDYHAHIHQPSGADKQIGETLFIEVEFEDHTGNKIEHINIKIRNKENLMVIYDEPADRTIANDVSAYDFQDQFPITFENGFTIGNWELIATVWGKDPGQDEVIEEVEFQVLP